MTKISAEDYMVVHDAAQAEYEAATPDDYRYSAIALRRAVDVGIAKHNELISPNSDLLAMLKVAKLWLEVDGRFDMQGINAAIAKAEGLMT